MEDFAGASVEYARSELRTRRLCRPQAATTTVSRRYSPRKRTVSATMRRLDTYAQRW